MDVGVGGWMRARWLAVGTLAWLVAAGFAVAADVGAARTAIREMMTASRAMLDEHARGDLALMAAAATRVIAAGERALAALPTPGNRHARDAADHVREAIEAARRVVETATTGRGDEAATHARRTISQVRRGAGHAEAL